MADSNFRYQLGETEFFIERDRWGYCLVKRHKNSGNKCEFQFKDWHHYSDIVSLGKTGAEEMLEILPNQLREHLEIGYYTNDARHNSSPLKLREELLEVINILEHQEGLLDALHELEVKTSPLKKR